MTYQTPMQYNTTAFDIGKRDTQSDTYFYLTVYLGLSAAAIAVGTAKYLAMYSASIRASRLMFQRLCHSVLRAPLRWIDTTPTGRILNRFTVFSIRTSPLMILIMLLG